MEYKRKPMHACVHAQSQLTRLVTLHSLWPSKVDTGKWSSISPSLITVIQQVIPIFFLAVVNDMLVFYYNYMRILQNYAIVNNSKSIISWQFLILHAICWQAKTLISPITKWVSKICWHTFSHVVDYRMETTPFLSGERDWQAAMLRVVPVRKESHAATRM